MSESNLTGRPGGAQDELHHTISAQALVICEMQHRAANLLSLVGALVRRWSLSGESFDDFDERLVALSRVDQFLSGVGAGSTLRTLVDLEFAPFLEFAPDIRLIGPDVELTDSEARLLALALHELVTNSVKHGVLGRGLGQLSLKWSLVPDASRTTLEMQWSEIGVRDGGRKRMNERGFGQELLQNRLEGVFAARCRLDVRDNGVSYTLATTIAAAGAAAPANVKAAHLPRL